MHLVDVAMTDAAVHRADKYVVVANGMAAEVVILEITILAEQSKTFGWDSLFLSIYCCAHNGQN